MTFLLSSFAVTPSGKRKANRNAMERISLLCFLFYFVAFNYIKTSFRSIGKVLFNKNKWSFNLKKSIYLLFYSNFSFTKIQLHLHTTLPDWRNVFLCHASFSNCLCKAAASNHMVVINYLARADLNELAIIKAKWGASRSRLPTSTQYNIKLGAAVAKLTCSIAFVTILRSENESLSFRVFQEKMAENILHQQHLLLFRHDTRSYACCARQPHASSIQATSQQRHCGQIQQI